MTTRRHIKVERAFWDFNYGEHQFDTPQPSATPEIFGAYLGYLACQRWRLSHVVSREETESVPLVLSHFQTPTPFGDDYQEVKRLEELKTFIIQNFSRMTSDEPVPILERLAEIPISKLAVVLSWGSWSIVSASFTEFNEHNANTRIGVILERRTVTG